MIERIESNMDQSVGFVERAVADTKKAAKFQQEARRVSRAGCTEKLSCILVCALLPHPILSFLLSFSPFLSFTPTETNDDHVLLCNPGCHWGILCLQLLQVGRLRSKQTTTDKQINKLATKQTSKQPELEGNTLLIPTIECLSLDQTIDPVPWI